MAMIEGKFELTDGEIVDLCMESAREYFQQTMKNLVRYLQDLSGGADNFGAVKAEAFVNELLQQGAIKPNLAIQLMQVIQNPQAEVELNFLP